MRSTLCLATIIALLLPACARRSAETGEDSAPRSSAPGATPTFSGNEQQDAATLERLANDARALASADGCSAAGQCRTAPLGARPCGGPREYLVYCSITTDSAALHRQLEVVRQYEDSLNRRYGRVSTCEFIAPPQTILDGRVCRAAAPDR